MKKTLWQKTGVPCRMLEKPKGVILNYLLHWFLIKAEKFIFVFWYLEKEVSRA